MRYAALVALLLGCPTGHEVVLDGDVRDAPSDAPRDAPRDVPIPDAPDDSCEPVSVAQCCCQGDALTDPPVCRDGRWVCALGYEYHTGFDCGWSCGAACSLPCDAGAPPICDGPGAFHDVAERSCLDETSCIAVLRQTDCCGTRAVTAVASHARVEFERAESTCVTRFPDCDCAPSPTVADDGSTGDPDDVLVECVEGRCRTRF